MANTFFGLDSALNNDDSSLLPDDEGDVGEGEENEYDALNDETFGSALNDDWEKQHEQFAHNEEKSSYLTGVDKMINEFTNLDVTNKVIDNMGHEKCIGLFSPKHTSPKLKQHQPPPGFSMPSQLQQSPTPNMPEISAQPQPSLREFGQTLLENVDIKFYENIFKMFKPIPKQKQQPPPGFSTPPKLQQSPRPNMPDMSPRHNRNQPRPPPGWSRMMPEPGSRLPPGLPPSCMPPLPIPGRQPFPPNMPMLRRDMAMPPRVINPRQLNNGPMGQFGNFSNFLIPPAVRNGVPIPPHIQQQHMRQQKENFIQQMQAQAQHQQMHYRHQQQQQQQQQQHPLHQPEHQHNGRSHNRNNAHPNNQQVRDEYAGLMTNREKQWLLNIQQLQLNTGTPYFDDYYFTIFKERKARTNKENQPGFPMQLHDRRNQQQRNRQDRNENPLTNRVYTPLQFENSLGKLQCLSVTAPRKIIDTDVVTLEKDNENTPTRDTRKTKQLLLELESLYSLVLKVEDLLNPTAITNMEKLFEIKQKQRLREMDAAATPEQKQELLKLLQDESRPPQENPVDYLMKIMATITQDDKFASFMNIRKGKTLLLRLLPLLGNDYTIDEYAALWCRVLLSIPLVGRRDMAGDNLLPRLHPYFKRFVQVCRMHDIIAIINKLEQTIRPTDNRCTPLSHQSKAPLQFVVGNRFGVSALVTILVRTEYLISSGNANEEQVEDWLNFLQSWAVATSGRVQIASPIEFIPLPVFIKHANRFVGLSEEKRLLLEKHYVDIN